MPSCIILLWKWDAVCWFASFFSSSGLPISVSSFHMLSLEMSEQGIYDFINCNFAAGRDTPTLTILFW